MTEQTPDAVGPNGSDPEAAPHLAHAGMTAMAANPELRDEVRRRIEETAESGRGIADDFGLPPGSLHRYAAREGWVRPPDAPKAACPAGFARPRKLAATIDDAGAVMGRVLRAVDRQVRMIETRLKKRDAAIEEKDARILGTLARTLATLMALERDDGATTRETEPVDRVQYRAELARRIAAWAEEGEEPAGAADGMERT
jgi:hypothetical protein